MDFMMFEVIAGIYARQVPQYSVFLYSHQLYALQRQRDRERYLKKNNLGIFDADPLLQITNGYSSDPGETPDPYPSKLS